MNTMMAGDKEKLNTKTKKGQNAKPLQKQRRKK